MHPRKTLPPIHAGEKHVGSKYSRWRLYEEARKPFREDRGTPYPCTQRDLDGYLKHERDNSKTRYVTAVVATNELCNWLNHFKEPDASSLAALERLKNGIQLKPWGPDLVVKAFKDLDLAFFKGTLLGNVRVKWMCCTEWNQCVGPPPCFGITRQDGHAQCRIILNAQAILLHPQMSPIPFREMWRTMLHEMCVSRKMLQLPFDNFEGSLRTSRRHYDTKNNS